MANLWQIYYTQALARAVYHRCKMVVLDDPFSALDGKTRDQVAQNLLGPKGLFRQLNAAVFWITSSSKWFMTYLNWHAAC